MDKARRICFLALEADDRLFVPRKSGWSFTLDPFTGPKFNEPDCSTQIDRTVVTPEAMRLSMSVPTWAAIPEFERFSLRGGLVLLSAPRPP